MLDASENGVLCSIDLTVKAGTSTSSGLAPFGTPYKSVSGLSIATCSMEPTSVLPSFNATCTLTAGDEYVSAEFVRSNDAV